MLLLALAGLGACAVAPDGPATPGSPSAEGAELAAELTALADQVHQDAMALQARCDPEQVQDGATPPAPADLDRALEELARGVEATGAKLDEIGVLARSAGGGVSAP